MQKALTKESTDHSDHASFSFSFFCDRCGKEWVSQTVPFESGGVTSVEHEEARQLLWAHEHRRAFEQANLEAHFHFNCCPECGSWVCDNCFGVDELGNDSKCKSCKG